MKISEKALTWVMRLYPPLLFQRIWVRSFEPGFSGVDVVIVKSFMNKNYNKSICGGTIFTATDPFYAILFDQVLQRRGLKCRVWLKSAQINYLKPGSKLLTQMRWKRSGGYKRMTQVRAFSDIFILRILPH